MSDQTSDHAPLEEAPNAAGPAVEAIQSIICEHSTAPMWDHLTQTLYFVDVSGNAVHRYHPETDSHDVLRVHRDRKVAFVALSDTSDQLLVGCGSSILKVDIGKDNKMQLDVNSYVHMDISVDVSKYRMIMGKISPYGELFFSVEPTVRKGSGAAGTSSGDNILFRMIPPKEKPGSQFQRYTLEEAVPAAEAPVQPAGLCWDHGGRSLYVADAIEKKLLRYVTVPFRSTLANREDVIDFSDISSGTPSGVAVDKEGCVWVAMEGAGEVVCVDPKKGFGLGQVIHSIKMPVRNINSCIFGGPNLEHLYITSRRSIASSNGKTGAKIEGSVFRIQLPGLVGGAGSYHWKRFATAGRYTGTMAGVMIGIAVTVWTTAEITREQQREAPTIPPARGGGSVSS